MRRTIPRRSAAPLAAALVTVLVTAGCGDVAVKAKGKDTQAKPDTTASASPTPDTSAGTGTWLLGMTTAGGADGESTTTTYVAYNPTTGEATKRALPPVSAASATPEQAALLVSASRKWAIPDTGISHAEEKSRKLKVYSLTDDTSTVVDIRQRSGQADLDPIGWAFDPARADTLRIVDTKNRVWAVSVAGGKATQESKLASGPWVFTNGFNPNTGEPWVESIDSDETKPAGNGAADTSPVQRDGGTVLPSGSPGLAKLPTSPCRLGAGYTDSTGGSWTFCADDAAVSTYHLAEGAQAWAAFGKPSQPVAPIAAGFPLVLPPAE
ncbi:MAG: hypothetical protein JWR90_916 [Marmoricola sp.]|jgi:hypothetical protein|nr:hypothetical protein [Marmoricola sp.]